MEPIILELEREENDLLIIAHESVLRVLYGYLMACNAADIPKLQFPRDEIIEVRDSVVLHDISLTDILQDHPLKLQQRRQTHQDSRSSTQHDPG
jgi:broad specificity phosphatase PhoE